MLMLSGLRSLTWSESSWTLGLGEASHLLPIDQSVVSRLNHAHFENSISHSLTHSVMMRSPVNLHTYWRKRSGWKRERAHTPPYVLTCTLQGG